MLKRIKLDSNDSLGVPIILFLCLILDSLTEKRKMDCLGHEKNFERQIPRKSSERDRHLSICACKISRFGRTSVADSIWR